MSAEPTLVELLYFDGCLGIHRVLPVVAPLAEAAGARLVQRRVETPQEAEARRFLGSPTVPHRGARGTWMRDALQRLTSSQHNAKP